MAKFKVKKINATESSKTEDINAIVSMAEAVTLDINKELRDLIPPLSASELASLEESIIAEGVRDPICYWTNAKGVNYIIDGHNRFSICSKLGLSYPTKKIDLPDFEAVKDWMLVLQLSRRNLTPNQASYLRGLQYTREKKGIGRPLGLDQNNSDKLSELNTTADRLAFKHGVTSRTIERDALFSTGLEYISHRDPQVKKDILAGIYKARKSDIQAIAQGKKSIDDLLRPVVIEEDILESNQEVYSDFNETQIRKLILAKTKINTIIGQLIHVGIDKKTIKKIFSEELKNK
ncbi:ParB N-terminal domain-containing protein [Aureibacter tunicatorum]|uniref:ParB/Sulfiredoxin domain-containing protein n=1 Tax=Aureibacter tunicatorum TaxID=866807 RepID=A0AAE4BT63_9BACT|nr:ParB N-terminal domain-containing protein [Aureibacter tunicatorum]MDR6241869.1 hypothetical protein [Aureibacter tunicatorum]BDD07476.1 hypothetical protein AUTU_49590 [Aureibacter tunicatorum]